MPRPDVADLVGEASNTLGDLQDFLMVVTLALCGDMTDLKAEQPSAFATVIAHCSTLATSARESCGRAIAAAEGRKAS